MIVALVGTECARQWLSAGAATHAKCGDGKLVDVFITGFPAGMLQCNCYVLAPQQGADAIVVDPGQRAMGPLRRILDENRLTPAAVLLTHGHIDHIWSAQKVADTYGCPRLHPSRGPVHAHRPDQGLRARGWRSWPVGAMFREPRQVVELDRDGDKIELGGFTVTVDHTPGHTRGSVVVPGRAPGPPTSWRFTGDTLFKQSDRPHRPATAAAGATC